MRLKEKLQKDFESLPNGSIQYLTEVTGLSRPTIRNMFEVEHTRLSTYEIVRDAVDDLLKIYNTFCELSKLLKLSHTAKSISRNTGLSEKVIRKMFNLDKSISITNVLLILDVYGDLLKSKK